MEAYLISEKVIKSETVVNDNVDSDLLKQAMATAQDIYLSEIIGSKLLKALENMVSTGKIQDVGSKDYKLLLDDYITPYLKFKVLSETVIPLTYKFRNQGVVQTADQYIQHQQMKDADMLKEYYNQRANAYAIRLEKYICKNATKYPEYKSCEKKAGFSTAIYLG